MDDIVIWIIIINIVTFPIIWIFAIKLMIKFSGLGNLQEKFPMTPLIDYRRFTRHKSRNGRLKKMNFNNCLTVHYNEEFLLIELMKIFSFGFNRVQIPLKKIKYNGEKRVFFFKYYSFDLDGLDFQLHGNCNQLIESIQKKTAS